MDAFRAVADLAVATARLWLRCVVLLLICLLLGDLAFEGLAAAAGRLGGWDERVGLPVLAIATLCSLAALVAMFLVAGRQVPAMRERAESARILDVVIVTLAPFLAFYALWGLLEPTIADHISDAVAHSGPGTTQAGFAQWERYIPIAAGAWLLKSALVRIRRRNLVLTTVITLLEAVWLFLAFFALTEGVQSGADWLQDRQVWHWIADAWDRLGQFSLPFSLTLPEILTQLWDWWTAIVWPGLKEAVAQPLVWLAITTLVFTRQTHTGRVDRAIQGLRWDRRVVVDVLTRDYRDKYLPVVAAVRSVLRLGLPFLSALCLLYVAVDAVADWLFVWAVGALDDTMQYPSYLSGSLDLGHLMLVEPLHVCLLTVAYARVVSRTPEPREAATGPSPADEPDRQRPSAPERQR